MWLRLAGKDLSKGLKSTRTRAVIPEDRRESLPSQLSVPWRVPDHDPRCSKSCVASVSSDLHIQSQRCWKKLVIFYRGAELGAGSAHISTSRGGSDCQHNIVLLLQ